MVELWVKHSDECQTRISPNRYTVSWFSQLNQIRVWSFFSYSLRLSDAVADQWSIYLGLSLSTFNDFMLAAAICHLLSLQQTTFAEWVRSLYKWSDTVRSRKMQDEIENLDNHDLRCHLGSVNEVRKGVSEFLDVAMVFPAFVRLPPWLRWVYDNISVIFEVDITTVRCHAA